MARTDDDTWGPDGGVGMTATFGAVARALATTKGLVNDPFAEQLVRAAGCSTSPGWSTTSGTPKTTATTRS